MNRKLHNIVMAMIASSSLFVLGLLTASPVVPSLGTTTPATAVASLAADEARTTDAVDRDVEQAEASPRRQIRRPRRQSVAMPFFSFAPRG